MVGIGNNYARSNQVEAGFRAQWSIRRGRYRGGPDLARRSRDWHRRYRARSRADGADHLMRAMTWLCFVAFGLPCILVLVATLVLVPLRWLGLF